MVGDGATLIVENNLKLTSANRDNHRWIKMAWYFCEANSERSVEEKNSLVCYCSMSAETLTNYMYVRR